VKTRQQDPSRCVNFSLSSLSSKSATNKGLVLLLLVESKCCNVLGFLILWFSSSRMLLLVIFWCFALAKQVEFEYTLNLIKSLDQLSDNEWIATQQIALVGHAVRTFPDDTGFIPSRYVDVNTMWVSFLNRTISAPFNCTNRTQMALISSIESVADISGVMDIKASLLMRIFSDVPNSGLFSFLTRTVCDERIRLVAATVIARSSSILLNEKNLTDFIWTNVLPNASIDLMVLILDPIASAFQRRKRNDYVSFAQDQISRRLSNVVFDLNSFQTVITCKGFSCCCFFFSYSLSSVITSLQEFRGFDSTNVILQRCVIVGKFRVTNVSKRIVHQAGTFPLSQNVFQGPVKLLNAAQSTLNILK
jgi:hypothetical protein